MESPKFLNFIKRAGNSWANHVYWAVQMPYLMSHQIPAKRTGASRASLLHVDGSDQSSAWGPTVQAEEISTDNE